SPARTVPGEQFVHALQGPGLAQVQAQREPPCVVGTHLREVPAALGLERETAAEAVLAQAALDHEDPARGQQRSVLHRRLGEEGALDPTAAVLELHEDLAVALLAHAYDLACDHSL